MSPARMPASCSGAALERGDHGDQPVLHLHRHPYPAVGRPGVALLEAGVLLRDPCRRCRDRPSPASMPSMASPLRVAVVDRLVVGGLQLVEDLLLQSVVIGSPRSRPPGSRSRRARPHARIEAQQEPTRDQKDGATRPATMNEGESYRCTPTSVTELSRSDHVSEIVRMGSTGEPFTRTSKCRCGPVEYPVLPTLPMTSPRFTFSPADTRIADWCA